MLQNRKFKQTVRCFTGSKISVALLLLILLCLQGRGQEQSTLPPVNLSTESFTDSVADIPENIRIPEVRVLVHTDPDSALSIIRYNLIMNAPGYNDWLFEYLLASGISQINKGAYEAAKRFSFQAVLQSRRTSQFFVNGSRAFNSIGNAFSYQSDFNAAAKYYYYAVVMAESDSAAGIYLGGFYNNMATILLSINQNERAIDYLDKAEATHIKNGTLYNLASIYNNKGVAYSRQGALEKAGEYFGKALQVSRQFHKTQSEIAALVNIGANFIERGQPEKGVPYLKSVVSMEKGVNPYYKEANALCLLGTACIYLKDYRQAEKYLQLTLQKAEQYGIPEFIREAHAQLADLYSDKGDYRNAYLHHTAFTRLKDSIISKEKSAAINTLEIKYRTAQKDKELAEKQLLIRDQEQQLAKKNIWITGISAGALMCIILLISIYQKYRHRQKLQEKQILILTQEQEISRLKAIMQGEEKERIRLARELHDGVGGTLAAVKMNFAVVQRNFRFLEKTESFTEAMEMLDIMSNELREAAHNLMPESILQYGLAESVSRYCEQIRKSKDLTIEFQSFGSFDQLDNETVLSVYRMIQELLHNIVKHAFATHAIVQLSQHDGLLSVILEDNGKGFDPALETKGIGLKNLRSRVDRMNGRISIETTPQNETGKTGGTTIYLEFKLTSQNTIPV